MIWANVHNMSMTLFVQLWQDYCDQNTESDLWNIPLRKEQQRCRCQKRIQLTHHSELCKSGRICSLTPSTWLVVFLPQISDRLSSHKCLWSIQSRLSLQRPHHTPKHYELPSLDVQTSSARDIPIQKIQNVNAAKCLIQHYLLLF